MLLPWSLGVEAGVVKAEAKGGAEAKDITVNRSNNRSNFLPLPNRQSQNQLP
jgi:hypothetical protein